MKLLVIFPEEFRGHLARAYHVYRLANSLAAEGVEVHLVGAPGREIAAGSTLGRTFGEAPDPRLHLHWRRRQFGPVQWGGWFYRQLDRLMATQPFDLALTMHLKAADHLRARHPGLPLVFEAHEIFADSYPPGSERHRALAAVESRVHAHAAGVVAISAYLAAELLARYQPAGPIRVQHDGIDPASLTPIDEAAIDPRALIYIGSLQAWKGVPVALEAMRHLPEFHLTVIGGRGRELEELKKSAPNNVTCLGHLARAELAPHLARASLGLMPNLLQPPSALSTFPLKLLEYSAAGRGIVASRIPALTGLPVERWVTPVESGSPTALAAGIRQAAQSPLDRAAAQAWASQFTWPEQGKRLHAFLHSLSPKLVSIHPPT